MNIPRLPAVLNAGRGAFRRPEWHARYSAGEFVLMRAPLRRNIVGNLLKLGFQFRDALVVERFWVSRTDEGTDELAVRSDGHAHCRSRIVGSSPADAVSR